MTDLLLRRLGWADALPPLALRVEQTLRLPRFLAALAIGLVSALALPAAAACAAAALGWAMLTLSWIDLRKGVLPHGATVVTAVAGLAWATAGGAEAARDALAGGALGFGVLAAMAALHRRLRGVDGLGGGDASLLGAIGCWVGWAEVATVLFGAACLALAMVMALRVAGRRLARGDAVPFGPFLCAAGWLAFLRLAALGEGAP